MSESDADAPAPEPEEIGGDLDAAVSAATGDGPDMGDAPAPEPDAGGGGLRDRLSGSIGGSVDLRATEPHQPLDDVDLADALRPDVLADTWRPRTARGLSKAGALDGKEAWIDLALGMAGMVWDSLEEPDADTGDGGDGGAEAGGTYEAEDGTEVRTA